MANIVPLSADAIRQAVDVLEAGGLVITPTRTQYNLISDAFSAEATDRVFHAKRRTKFGPLTLSIADPAVCARYVRLPDWLDPETPKEMWPGELTAIFWKNCDLPSNFTMGYDTLGVACQGPSPLEDIIRAFGRPVGATSANISGQGDIFVDLEKAVSDIGDEVDLIIDNGSQTLGASSSATVKANTVIDLTFDMPYLVRAGVYPVDRVRGLIPNLNEDSAAYKARLAERVQQVSGKPAKV